MNLGVGAYRYACCSSWGELCLGTKCQESLYPFSGQLMYVPNPPLHSKVVEFKLPGWWGRLIPTSGPTCATSLPMLCDLTVRGQRSHTRTHAKSCLLLLLLPLLLQD
jgi:hypothetical protein